MKEKMLALRRCELADIVSPMPRRSKKMRRMTVELPDRDVRFFERLDVDFQQLLRWLLYDFKRKLLREKAEAMRYVRYALEDLGEGYEEDEEIPAPLKVATAKFPYYIR